MRTRAVVVLLLFALMFGVSSESYAFLEWLHKLSGPGPFWGLRPEIRFDPQDGWKFVEWTLPIPPPRGWTDELGPSEQDSEVSGEFPGMPGEWPKWTVSFAPGWLDSLDNDLDYGNSRAPNVTIWSAEVAAQRWFKGNEWYFGVGLAGHRFTGGRFRDFSRGSVVARLAKRCDLNNGWRLEAAANYYHFNKHFRPQDFGARGNERESPGVLGLSIVISP